MLFNENSVFCSSIMMVHYSFAVIKKEEEMLLAANSEEEKYKWMEVRFQLADVPR